MMVRHNLSRKGTVLAASFLAAAFTVTGGLAIQGHTQAAAYRRLLNNGYQHAFTELTTAVSELDTALQKGLYATSPAMISSLCAEAFGRTVSAQMALGELPYANVELEQTAAFIAKAGDYAMALSRAALSGGETSADTRETLRVLSASTTALNRTLQSLQSDLNAGAITLEDLETAQQRLSQATEDGEHILAGSAFQTVENDFPEVPALIYDGPFSEHLADRAPKMLEGRGEVNRDEARAAAARFLSLKPEIFDFVSESGGALPTWDFSARVDGGELFVRVSKAGGLVVELLNSRPVAEQILTREQAIETAAAFLEEQGYPGMAESYDIRQGNILTVNFAATQDGVICYPDLIKVSVALDNGRIVGFEAQGYLTNHTPRSLDAPAVSAAKAREWVSPDLTILSHQPALIPTGGKYEVLCHEFKCRTPDGKHYIIYVNAATGQEQKILILLEDESGTLVI